MVQARTVLWYYVFAGFAVNYMIRLNINIAIVGMVKPKTLIDKKENISQILVLNSTKTEDGKNADALIKNVEDNLFEWDEIQQNYVLGAFFWSCWITQIPGGVLARKYGTKKVFGWSNGGISLITFFIPVCAHWNLSSLILLRVLQGLVSGLSWPAMHHMTAIWIPQNERSKFVSAYLGSSFGAAFTYPICGLIMDSLTWEWVFYVTGLMGLVWFIGWHFFVHDSPAHHPRITEKEKDYILSSNGGVSHQKTMLPAVPWREILTSRALMMNIVAQFGAIWGLFTLLTQAPTYLKNIHGLNIRMNGLYSGLPHLTRWGFSHVFAIFCDQLLKSDKFSKTTVRKIAATFSILFQGLLLVVMAFSGHNTTLAIFLLFAATTVNGAVSSGPLASLVDLSPNFASVLQGISGMIGSFPGFISPPIVAYFTYKNQTEEQWQKVFLLVGAIIIVCGIVYDIFATSELQPWNDLSLKESELERINKLKNSNKIIIRRRDENNLKSAENETEKKTGSKA